MTREELDELIASGLEAMDDAVQAAWRAMRIEPEKWRCSPWGDEGGGFWVVAETGGQVVWYNEIEAGFNVGRFTTRGIISEYACNQTSLEEFLLGLPEAEEAESWSDPRPGTVVPSELQGGGAIVRRQTTYWDLRAVGGSHWRLRFKAKAEARFVTSEFLKLELSDSHPVLGQYLEPWSQLFFAGTPIDPTTLQRVLAEVVSNAFDGWRTLDDYLNKSADLMRGYGLLLRAPRSVVLTAAALLDEMGLATSILDAAPPGESRRAVTMDRNVIVAREFRFERLDAA